MEPVGITDSTIAGKKNPDTKQISSDRCASDLMQYG
jgi:hypothetical protein